jgi:hypothetical protein
MATEKIWLPYPITTENLRSQGLATKKIQLMYPMAIEICFGCHKVEYRD